MSLSIAKLAATAVLAVLPFTASASLISPLEYKSGNLTWLQLSETSGLSLDDFTKGVGGWNAKYRLAQDSEIDTLLASFGLQLGDTGYQSEGFGAGEFVFNVGGMTEDGLDGTYFEDGNQGAKGRGLSRYVWAELTNGYYPWPLGPNCDAYFSCSRFSANSDLQFLSARQQDTGLFVIRRDAVEPPPISVPEPSSLALFGAGAFLAYQRRKKK